MKIRLGIVQLEQLELQTGQEILQAVLFNGEAGKFEREQEFQGCITVGKYENSLE